LAAPLDRLHQIWVPSRFVRRALRAITPVPVRVVPPLIVQPPLSARRRHSLRLEDDRFYFLTIARSGNSASRIDIDATLLALRHALQASPVSIGLVMLVDEDVGESDRERLAEACEGLPVVKQVCAAGSPVVRQSFLEACDALLWLHSGDALDVAPIEAMRMAKPVIATAYGGVGDYLSTATGFPVGFRLEPTEASCGPYPAGILRACPCPDGAASAMQTVARAGARVRQRVSAATTAVEVRYGARAVGRSLQQALAPLAR
jgi:glycosyltransferase involved in cell wall biosynthesis